MSHSANKDIPADPNQTDLETAPAQQAPDPYANPYASGTLMHQWWEVSERPRVDAEAQHLRTYTGLPPDTPLNELRTAGSEKYDATTFYLWMGYHTVDYRQRHGGADTPAERAARRRAANLLLKALES